MQSVLIVIHLMIVVALVVTVLLQRSEGGALGVGGGGFMTGRGQANVLTRATAILATLFFATSLGLTVLARWNRAPESIIQTDVPAKTGTETPAKQESSPGNLLNQLKQMEEQRAPSPAPAQVPTAPATPQSSPKAPISPQKK